MRVILHIDQRARVEVNDRIVAETTGFRNATALAELYTRSRELLLVEERHRHTSKPESCRYYHIGLAPGAYEVCASGDPVAFVHDAEQLGPLGRFDTLTRAIDAARADAGTPLIPAFSDQEETFDGLGQHGSDGLIVAVWTSRWRTPFVTILEEDEYTPLFLAVSKARDGAYYTIYRLADGRYLSEIRSHHLAERIGAPDRLNAAVAACDLFNAARQSGDWIALPVSAAAQRGAGYRLSEEKDGYHLRTVGTDGADLGCFTSIRLAEAYATVHRDALAHFHV